MEDVMPDKERFLCNDACFFTTHIKNMRDLAGEGGMVPRMMEGEMERAERAGLLG